MKISQNFLIFLSSLRLFIFFFKFLARGSVVNFFVGISEVIVLRFSTVDFCRGFLLLFSIVIFHKCFLLGFLVVRFWVGFFTVVFRWVFVIIFCICFLMGFGLRYFYGGIFVVILAGFFFFFFLFVGGVVCSFI